MILLRYIVGLFQLGVFEGAAVSILISLEDEYGICICANLPEVRLYCM